MMKQAAQEAAQPVTLTVTTPNGKAELTVRHLRGRRWEVVDFDDLREDDVHTVLAFHPSGPGIENLDENSDAMQVFNRSTKVRYNGVVLGNREMLASSLEELEYALKNVKIRPFCPEEI